MALKISVGTSDFREYRRYGAHYVDKTAFLKEFLVDPPEVTLFTRPRRFGKTMTMSMMAHFLDIQERESEGSDIFEGLEVTKGEDGEAVCAKWMHQHPVIFLSFQGIETETFDEAYIKIRNLFSSIVLEFDYLLASKNLKGPQKEDLSNIIYKIADRDTVERTLLLLSAALHAHHGKKAIVLIDEYDVPIARARKHGFYERMLLFMRNILQAAFKGNTNIRFGVMTGCLRVVRESLFTGLNNVSCYDISMPIYSDAFGFTSAEVTKLLETAGLSHRKQEFREWYNGYRFGDRQDMYCPWDIMGRIKDLQKNSATEPECYWAHSTDNAVIGEFVREMKSDVLDKMIALCGGGYVKTAVADSLNYRELEYGTIRLSGETAAKPDDSEREVREANFWSLLYHTGYLTVASEERTRAEGLSPSASVKALVIPNRGIATVYDKELMPLFRGLLSGVDVDALIDALWHMDEAVLQRSLAEMISTVGEHSREERFYHGVLHAVLRLRYEVVCSDLQGGSGRYDILVRDLGRKAALVIEIKRTRNQRQLDGFAVKALGQISEREYDAGVDREKYPAIIHWGIVFCGHRCLAKARDASASVCAQRSDA